MPYMLQPHLFQPTWKRCPNEGSKQNRTLQVVPGSMHNKLEPILGDFTALSQSLGGRPKLAFRQWPYLNSILTSNKKQLNNNTNMEPDPATTSTSTPTAPLQAPKTSQCHCFICNIIHAIICQQCPMNTIKDKQARLCTKN